MKAYVNLSKRIATQRAHTATHLLHAALAERFPHTKQAGSLVDADYVRFDFVHDDLLTVEQLADISDQVNDRIAQALPVKILQMSYDEAIAQWAKAFFEDSYGDQVRVVCVGSAPWYVSQELCGGTHVSRTSDIGGIVVTDHGSVASWVKRIAAYVGNKVASYAQDLIQKQETYAEILQVQENHIEAKLEKHLKEYKVLQEKVEQLATHLISYITQSWNLAATASSGSEGSWTSDRVYKNLDVYEELNVLSWKTRVSHVRSALPDDVSVCIYSRSGNFACIGPGAKQYVREKWWRGGWSDTFVQGKDKAVLEH